VPRIVFVDTVLPTILNRLQASTPPGFELVVAGPEPAERRRLLKEADYLLTWSGPVGTELLDSAERVKLVQKVGQGVDNIDLAAARARGIPVCNAGGANTTSVAEHTILLMLSVYRRITALQNDVKGGSWPKWEYREVSREISGRNVGLIGLGNIGRKVAQRLGGWECQVAFNDIVDVPEDARHRLNVSPMGLDNLLRWADIVSLHVYLDEATRGLIGAAELALMRPSAILINTSRGEVVDEGALIAALDQGRLFGAGLDVMHREPPDPRNPLLAMDNVVVTSHIAAGTWDSLERTIRWAMANCARVERGEWPEFVQNGVLPGRD
jgi:phosphoglycerate dehydrogenase-like enzyme